MRLHLLASLIGLAAIAAPASSAFAQCAQGNGVSRVIEVDTTGGPRFGHNQYPGPETLKPGEVALTFDDGPHKQLTPAILATLDAHCVKATFFMVGQRALLYPGLAREVAHRGHTVATHTWSHRNLKSTPQAAGISEIELGISGVQRALGAPAAPFFRFPYLSDPGYAQQHLRQRNTAMFSIDVDSYDFRTRSPSVVIRNVTNQLKTKKRGIILFHDIQPSTAGALGALLTDLKASGYRFVHFVPRAPQTTIASYDKQVSGQKLGSLSTGGLGLAQRTAVNPAWEPRVIPYRNRGPAPSGGSQYSSAGVQAAPQPSQAVAQPAPPPVVARPLPQRADDDWRSTIFRGY